MNTAIPPRLGRYQVQKEIGKGSMGVVYLAQDPLIGRSVALKTFRIADIQDQELVESRERFIREAQSAGILSHPNIVTIHDVVDGSAEGATFIAMEYIQGTDLKELLRHDEPFDLATVADYIWQVADALEYAHSKNVVHRDIKPANILITGDGRVKLTDFGIARLNTSSLTHAGQLLGTPNYMAPEQILGKDVDRRADIFSLGVVLYEMLTRQKPFRGDNLTMVTHKIVHEPFTPLEEYVTDLPLGVRPILAKALAKNPAERYQRVGELARDLKRIADEAADQAALHDTQEIAIEEAKGAGKAAGPTLDDTEEMARRAAAAMAAPPPPPPPPGEMLRVEPLPPLPVPGAAAAAAPAVRQAAKKGGLTPLKLVAILAALLALGGIVAVLLFLQLAQRSEPPAPPAVVDAGAADQARLVNLLSEVQRLLAAGDLSAASIQLAEAEALAPADAGVVRLRQVLAAASAVQVAAADRDQEVAGLLARGEEAFGRKRFGEAGDLARQALALAPGHAPALDLLARAEAASAHARGSTAEKAPPAPAPRPPTVAGPAAPAPIEAAPEAPPEPPPGTPATLALTFHSEVSQGVLTIYAGQQQLLRESFRFVEKKGLLRSKAVSGGFSRELKIVPGSQTLRVYVALDKTHTEAIEGNFRPGATRTLEVAVDENGALTVQLR